MREATNERPLVLAQWALSLALGLTAAAYAFLGTVVVDLFRFLYASLGSALPLPTEWVFTPGVVPGLALGFLAAAFALHVILRKKKPLLVSGLALLLACSAGLLSFLLFALVLPLMKLQQPLVIS